jgi:hypothetical protein
MVCAVRHLMLGRMSLLSVGTSGIEEKRDNKRRSNDSYDVIEGRPGFSTLHENLLFSKVEAGLIGVPPAVTASASASAARVKSKHRDDDRVRAPQQLSAAPP